MEVFIRISMVSYNKYTQKIILGSSSKIFLDTNYIPRLFQVFQTLANHASKIMAMLAM